MQLRAVKIRDYTECPNKHRFGVVRGTSNLYVSGDSEGRLALLTNLNPFLCVFDCALAHVNYTSSKGAPARHGPNGRCIQ